MSNFEKGDIIVQVGNESISGLAEFRYELYRYKVGDKVQVLKSGKVFTIGNMIWDDEDCDIYYYNAVDIEYYNADALCFPDGKPGDESSPLHYNII